MALNRSKILRVFNRTEIASDKGCFALNGCFKTARAASRAIKAQHGAIVSPGEIQEIEAVRETIELPSHLYRRFGTITESVTETVYKRKENQ